MNKLLRQAGIQEDDLLIVSDVSVVGCVTAVTAIYCCAESVQNHFSPFQPIILAPNFSPSEKTLENSLLERRLPKTMQTIFQMTRTINMFLYLISVDHQRPENGFHKS